jgi:hypothetical protein
MNVLLESTSLNYTYCKEYSRFTLINKFWRISKNKSVGNTLMMDSDIKKKLGVEE